MFFVCKTGETLRSSGKPLTAAQKVKMLLPWVGKHFPDGVCPFCGRRLVTDFHRSDCILYKPKSYYQMKDERHVKPVNLSEFRPGSYA